MQNHGLYLRENDALNVAQPVRWLVEEPVKVLGTIALVVWADAHCGEPGWQDLEEFEDNGELLVNTVGFLVSADADGGKKDHVTLWQTLCDSEGIHPFHIPVGMVRKIIVLNT